MINLGKHNNSLRLKALLNMGHRQSMSKEAQIFALSSALSLKKITKVKSNNSKHGWGKRPTACFDDVSLPLGSVKETTWAKPGAWQMAAGSSYC